MNEEKFIQYMKKSKKPINTINYYVKLVKAYEDYLQSHRQVSDLDVANSQDLIAYIHWMIERGENAYQRLWGVRNYYEFMQHDSMAKTTWGWMEHLQNETRKLGEFPKVDQSSVKKLTAVGISTVNQLLRAASTQEERQVLSEKSGAPLEAIEELYKLSELSRLPGLKKIRGRLFYEAGLDTLASIAAREAEEVQSILQDYVEKSGYEGVAPVLCEAQATVVMANFLLEKTTT